MNKLTRCDPRFVDVLVSDLAFAAIVKMLTNDCQGPPIRKCKQITENSFGKDCRFYFQ